MAFKWHFGKKKGKDAVETSVEMTSDTLHNDEEILVPKAEEQTLPDAAASNAEAEGAFVDSREEVIAESGSEEEIPAEPFVATEEGASQDRVSEESVEEPVSEASEEPVGEVLKEDAPLAEGIPEEVSEEEPIAETVSTENAEPEDAAAEEEAPAGAEEITPEAMADAALLDDDAAITVPVMDAPAEEEAKPEAVEPTAEEPAEGEQSFVMDDEYMRAFMEEGAMDDYIYSGDFEERQNLLDKIADDAATLAEEGTELLEQKAKEQEENKKKEPRYNEKGELLNDDGKVVLKRSLENKLILADTRERRYYNKLKNDLLAYQGVKAEMQSATEVFRVGKEVVARLSIAGYTRIYFALDPDEFDVDRYKQADKTEVDFEDAKMLLRIRNDDEYAIAVELLAIMMGARNIDRVAAPVTEDYLPAFPRREDAVLDKKGKYLAFEAQDEQALIREKRAEERKAAGISEEEVAAPSAEEEAKEEPLVILPLTLDNKIHQSTNTIKLLYSKLKNEILSYKTVRAEMTVKNENFKVAKKIIARMTVVGDVVRLYLALDPEEYSTRKYKHRDASDQQGYEGTRLMMKIAGETERALASKLIAELMKKLGLERNKRYAYVPYAEKYPYIKNGVFKGDEDKPRVKHEGEEYADIYGELTEHLRSQMGATDAWGVPKGYTAEDGLTARDLLELQRSKAKTINAGVALATPIVYFYDAAINEAGEVQYLNVQQVLNDKFLGKMIPQEYFAIAESSTRIEELNFFALDTVVKDCNENPNLRFVTKISCRLLLKQETLTKLVEKMKTEHGNLILAFDCAMLEAVGFVGISAINALKSQGALIMIDNAESASMRVLTEYDFDYLRLDARYYNGDSSKRLAHLDMITGYAAVENIITTSINCEHKEEARILLNHGVKVIQGDAVARPMRLINLALTNIKPVPKVRKDGENNG